MLKYRDFGRLLYCYVTYDVIHVSCTESIAGEFTLCSNIMYIMLPSKNESVEET